MIAIFGVQTKVTFSKKYKNLVKIDQFLRDQRLKLIYRETSFKLLKNYTIN